MIVGLSDAESQIDFNQIQSRLGRQYSHSMVIFLLIYPLCLKQVMYICPIYIHLNQNPKCAQGLDIQLGDSRVFVCIFFLRLYECVRSNHGMI